MKILLTTTSFQDTPGIHHDLLNSQDWDIWHLRYPPEFDLTEFPPFLPAGEEVH